MQCSDRLDPTWTWALGGIYRNVFYIRMKGLHSVLKFHLACQTLADIVEMIVASQFVMISTIYLDIMVVS